MKDILRSVLLASFALFFACPALAQSGDTTGLSGRVIDPSGAAVPEVSVWVARSETGDTRTIRTNALGYWETRFLPPGLYAVTFENTGFRTLVREGVNVTSGVLGTLDVELEIGQVAESLIVTADTELLTTNSAEIVRSVDQLELESLPTSARNFTQLLATEPGVSADLSPLLSNNNASISPSVNGARTTNNSFVFNGIDVTNMLCCNDRVNGAAGTLNQGGGSLSRNIAPALETLAEVKLQTSLYDASTGRNGGGNFQIVSRSGTNNFHGTLYHYLQNDKLISNDFFFERAGLPKQTLRRNEGGFTVGGPIYRNRTFFFGSYQYTRGATAYIDEASNTVRMPRDLTDDRSDAGINAFARALGVSNPTAINPISRRLLQARFQDGSWLIPSGSNGANCRADEEAESCQKDDHQQQVQTCRNNKTFFGQPIHQRLSGSVRSEYLVMPLR